MKNFSHNYMMLRPFEYTSVISQWSPPHSGDKWITVIINNEETNIMSRASRCICIAGFGVVGVDCCRGPWGHVRPAENETNQEGAPKDSQRVHAAVHMPSAMTSQRVAQGCGCPVKNVTAGKEMAAWGHRGPLFFSPSSSPSLHGDRAQIASRQRRWSLQMLDFGIISFRPVAWEKINKEYVYKYKYIRRRQNVSDRAVNDNAAGEPCGNVCLSLLEGNDLHPSWHFPTAHPYTPLQWG